MKKIINIKYKDIEEKTALKLKEMSIEEREHILGTLAVNEEWEKLMECAEYINAHRINPILRNLSFHRWLLVNPNKMAFEVWKKVRLKKEKSPDSYYWNNSAALLLYFNMPERLGALDKKDWEGSIVPYLLYKDGEKFKSDTISKEDRERIDGSLRETHMVNSIDLLFLRGHINVAYKVLSADTSYNLLKSIKYYFINENTFPIAPLIKLFKNYYARMSKINRDEIMANFFINSLEYLNIKNIKIIWKSLENSSRNCFFSLVNGRMYSFYVDSIFLKRDIKTIDNIQRMCQGNDKKTKINYYFDVLKKCLENGLINHVDFLLKKYPEWLEYSLNINIGDYIRSRGTPLVLSVLNNKQEITKLLLLKGAKTDSLKEINECLNKLEDDGHNSWGNKALYIFKINVERTLLIKETIMGYEQNVAQAKQNSLFFL